MRSVAALLVVSALACASEPQVTDKTRPQYQRPLVTDQLPFLAHRQWVRARLSRHDWCQRRTWPHSDEFVICDKRPYLDRSTPPMFSVVAYDSEDRTTAYAVFTPVPCRMYGRCDRLGEGANVMEYDFVDHDRGLRSGLVLVGENAEHLDQELGSMQQRMVDALTVELSTRFGSPVWRDRHHYGTAWSTENSDVGLFVVGNGEWVVETHELRRTTPPGLTY
jgi:hypothetical protein